MSVQDYRINAEVRRHLVSRWVDIQQLQLGTTNGVVYVIGELDTTMEDPRRRLDEGTRRSSADRVLRLAMRLEREIRTIRDVRDVVFKLKNVYKRGGRWRAVGAENEATSSRIGAEHAVRSFAVREVVVDSAASDGRDAVPGPAGERAALDELREESPS
jgi:hypothetical protein